MVDFYQTEKHTLPLLYQTSDTHHQDRWLHHRCLNLPKTFRQGFSRRNHTEMRRRAHYFDLQIQTQQPMLQQQKHTWVTITVCSFNQSDKQAPKKQQWPRTIYNITNKNHPFLCVLLSRKQNTKADPESAKEKKETSFRLKGGEIDLRKSEQSCENPWNRISPWSTIRGGEEKTLEIRGDGG